MRISRRSIATLATLALSAVPRVLAAEPATAPANEVAPSAATPTPTPSDPARPGLAVVFEPSAAELPQDDIRAAIANELGTTLTSTTDPAPRTLSIAVDGNRLIIRLRTVDGLTERLLPLPSERAQIAVVLGLIAGNLARDQRATVRPEPAPTPPAAVASPNPKEELPISPPPAGRPKPRRPKLDWLGVHIAQDIAFVGAHNACDPTLGQASDNFACFYEGTRDEPFFHTPHPTEDEVPSRARAATTRLLLSYEHAFVPSFTVGGRLGVAFGGGPPAGQERPQGVNDPPAHAQGRNGTPFMPFHVEVRAAYWFLPLTDELLRGYVLVGGGLAQVDTKATLDEYDCEDAGQDPNREPYFDPQNPSLPATPGTPGSISPYDQCRSGKKTFYSTSNHQPVRVDAWKKMGETFVELGLGGVVALDASLGINFEAKLIHLFPAAGVVVEPSLGIVYGL